MSPDINTGMGDRFLSALRCCFIKTLILVFICAYGLSGDGNLLLDKQGAFLFRVYISGKKLLKCPIPAVYIVILDDTMKRTPFHIKYLSFFCLFYEIF